MSLALAAGAAGVFLRPHHSAAPVLAAPDLPPPPAPALHVPRPVQLDAHAPFARWAAVLRTVEALRAPKASSAEVTTLATRTPEGTANIVLVLADHRSPSGRLWVKVSLAILPNESTAWVPRSALGGYTIVTTHVDVDLEHFRLVLRRGAHVVFSAPIGVGRPRTPTPRGQFYVRDRLDGFGDPFYGPLAFGTSARSPTLTDWPDGGYIGIHGTNEPNLIPGRISHGCIRLRNADILRLGRLMPVGTPVTIR